MAEKTSDQISRELFEHLVHLAALELPPEEAEYLRKELNNQLKAIHELKTIPLDPGIPATSHGVPYTRLITPALREDEWIACPNPEDIVEQAPVVAEGYVIVPDIPHTELE